MRSGSVRGRPAVHRMSVNVWIPRRRYAERHPVRTVEFDGKPYDCQPAHDLVIARDHLLRFSEEIGFLGATKQNALRSRLASYGPRGPYRERFIATP